MTTAELAQWTSRHRRHLHKHPELSLKEAGTSEYCRRVMTELGYTVRQCWGHGFIADLDPSSGRPDRRVALRCDMDALPIQELNNHDFVSTCQGVAHMCGHDTHMAVAMAAARLLVASRDRMPVGVRFLFQPCEETPPGGALGMIEKGCLEGIDEVFGLHNDPGTPVGQIRTRVGPLTAAADRFSLTITGKGCHAARPQDGLDPIPAAASTVLDWQTIISRRLDPVHPAVLSITQFHAGTTFNIIPDSARLDGTVRTFHESDRQMIQQAMETTLPGLKARGFGVELSYQRGYDSIVNHASGVERVVKAANSVAVRNDGRPAVDSATDPVAWGEDFSYYLQHRPGCFFFLGSGNREMGISEPLHSPRFDVDEACLPIGAMVMAELVLGA